MANVNIMIKDLPRATSVDTDDDFILDQRDATRVISVDSFISSTGVATLSDLSGYALESEVADGFTSKAELGSPSGLKLVGRCLDISTLRETEPTVAGQKIDVVSYRAGVSGGGGYFQYDNADTSTTDDGVACFVTPGGKRWKRIMSGAFVTPEMAGAAGDGQTDDTPAFKLAISYSKFNGYMPVLLGAKSYVISDTLYLMGSSTQSSSEGCPLVGVNWKATKLLFKPSSAIACVKLNGVSGNISSCYVRDLHILPFDSTYVEIGYGLEISGADMVPFDNLLIEQMAINFRLHNELTGTWTEFNKFNDCESRYGKVGVQFKRTLGNDSFHGTVFNNFRIQVKQGGGIGIQTQGAASGAIAWLYNCKFDVKFFGGNTCYAFDINNTNTSNNTGNFTAEGNLIFKSDDNSWFIHNGRFDTISGITYQIANEIAVKLGRFVFSNRASKNTLNFTDPTLSAYNAGITYSPFDISAATAAGYQFRAVGANFNSPVFSCLSGGDNGFYFGNIGSAEGVDGWHAGFKISAGGGILTCYNPDGLQLAIGSTSYATLSNVSFRPTTNAGIGIGAATVRFNAGYLTGWNFTAASLLPTTTAASNIGSPSNTVNNIYAQNAVTVVSDRNYKAYVQDIPQALIDAVGSVKYQMWQLRDAIAEKTEAEARWHVGVIAQEVKDAITEAGLDWKRYGLITYQETSVVIQKDEDGNYSPVDPESDFPVDANGYIVSNSDADVIETSGEITTLTRPIYMMRMDQFLTLKMAYLESRLA